MAPVTSCSSGTCITQSITQRIFWSGTKNHHELLGAEKNVEAASAPILLVVGFYLRDKVAVDSKQFTIEYDLRKITSTTRVN